MELPDYISAAKRKRTDYSQFVRLGWCVERDHPGAHQQCTVTYVNRQMVNVRIDAPDAPTIHEVMTPYRFIQRYWQAPA